MSGLGNEIFGSDDEDDFDLPSSSRPGSAARVQSREVIEEDEDRDGQAGTAWSDDDIDDDEQAQDELVQPENLEGPPLVLLAPPSQPAVKREDLKLVKQSNLINIQNKPFDKDTFQPEEPKFTDEKGTVRYRLPGNTVRWRHATDPETGQQYRQSNARFVRWSDGSLQLLLGSEVLDVASQDVTADQAYLFARQTGYIQAQALMPTRFAFRPTSVTSKFHKQLADLMGKEHAKQQKVRHVSTIVDPKKAKEEREKAEEERIRGRESLYRRQNAAMRRQTTKLPNRLFTRMQPAPLSATMLEAEDEYEDEDEDEGLNPTEAARRAVARPRRDDAAEREAERRLASIKQTAAAPRPGQKRGRLEDSEDEAISDEEDPALQDFIAGDDEEDDIGAKRQPRRGAALMLDDDDDDI